MLLKLVDLFAFLSVILRAGTLVFQSLLLGGVLFVLWVARSSPEAAPDSIARIQKSSWRLLQISAVGLAIVQLLYLYVNSAVLMATAEIGFDGVVGANFFISGCIVLTAALMTAVVASGNKNIAKWALPVLAVMVMGASVMTNHAASRLTGRPLLITLSSVHELATGFWIGGLPFLVLGLYRAKDLTTQWYVTERFSRHGAGQCGIPGAQRHHHERALHRIVERRGGHRLRRHGRGQSDHAGGPADTRRSEFPAAAEHDERACVTATAPPDRSRSRNRYHGDSHRGVADLAASGGRPGQRHGEPAPDLSAHQAYAAEAYV